MNEVIKKDIILVISNLLEILEVEEEKDIIEIRELSNHTIHNSSIFQDEDSVSIAILVYSLSKIIERREGKLNYGVFAELLRKARDDLSTYKVDAYRSNINKIFKLISGIDTKLKLYIEEVINQAQIKKGSKLYEHGISMARAADILGISQWELSSYVGKTTISDMGGPVNVRERLRFARGLF